MFHLAATLGKTVDEVSTISWSEYLGWIEYFQWLNDGGDEEPDLLKEFKLK